MAMSSLTPGVLFKSPGLNQRHTPTQITESSDQVKNKYRRESIPDKTWPPESPVAKVYDIRNTSSNLIILNNKMDKKSHLRVQSGRYRTPSDSGEDKERGVEPERHLAVKMTKSTRHDECYNSSSPMYQPTPSRPHTTTSAHRRAAGRYPATPGQARPSEWHHYSSQVDAPRRICSAPPQRTNYSGVKKKSLEPPPCFSRDKRWLLHPDMTRGQKKYMNSIARTYDVTDMKQLKQAQYLQLIYREQQRDFFTPEQYKIYLKYLASERTRQFNTKPPPPTHVKAKPKAKKPRKTKQSKEIKHETESETESGYEEGPRQSAPKPAHERPKPADNNTENTKPKKSDKDVKSNDDTEYMTYSQPENPKRDKPVRPKSHKVSSRQGGKRTPPTNSSNSPTSSLSLSEDEREAKKSDEKEKYWQQPAPPLKETEPDGRGLSMNKRGDLDKDREVLEKISSDEESEDKVTYLSSDEKNTSEDEQKPTREPKPARLVEQPKSEPEEPKTHDIEHKDGTKTRVYAPPIDDDIPVIKEETTPRGDS